MPDKRRRRARRKTPTRGHAHARSAQRPRKTGKQSNAVLFTGAIIIIIAAVAIAYFYGPYASAYPGTTVSSSTSTGTTASTTVTLIASPLALPAPAPDSQLVRLGAATNITDTGATGGMRPYSYQWLGSVTDMKSNFTADYGNVLCVNTAQKPTCNFQTVYGYNNLQPGFYYLKLRVTDSSMSKQSLTSATVSVDVIG